MTEHRAVDVGPAGKSVQRTQVPTSHVLELARLVAAPGTRASLLTPDQKVAGRVSIEQAVSLGAPFFVRVADRVLAADFDADDAALQADHLYWRCRMSGAPVLLLASGQGQRRHVFAWFTDRGRQRDLMVIAKELGADLRADIRPPLAPHRLAGQGVHPRLLRPHSPDAALTLLSGASELRRWSQDMQFKVCHGHAGYRSRSEFLRGVALAAVNARWPLADTLDLLTSGSCAASIAYLDRGAQLGEERTIRWFAEQVWPGAVRKADLEPARRQEPDPLLLQLAIMAAQRRWSGLRSSDSAVYAALLDKAILFGGCEVNASRRELQERTGLKSVRAVEGALSRLQDNGFLYRVGRRPAPRSGVDDVGGPRARRWRLLPQPMTQEHQGALELGESHGLAHDAFQNGAGLGKNAHRVWLVMGRSPGSSSTVLADGLGIGLRTVRKHLRRLHGCGLTESDGNDHWFQTSRDLDQVAAELGTLGNADAQRARHGRERWAYEILRADRRGRETVRKSESM